jgi:hypothetical protein
MDIIIRHLILYGSREVKKKNPLIFSVLCIMKKKIQKINKKNDREEKMENIRAQREKLMRFKVKSE